ncbi:MAG: hypothetical protein ACXVJD_08680 [Mucilaginibacter sp.]
MLIPEEVFKRRRRHNNTPESVTLIITNFIVVAIADTLFSSNHHLNWFFWVVIAVLAVYDFFTIRKNYEVFSNIDKIALLVSIPILALMVYILQ